MHAGARQPGMTGQVKEEVLTRFAELGIRVRDGKITVQPALLRRQEFRTEPGKLCFLDSKDEWKVVDVPSSGLAFTFCQLPIVYVLDDRADHGIAVTRADGTTTHLEVFELDPELSDSIFEKSGSTRQLTVYLGAKHLLAE